MNISFYTACLFRPFHWYCNKHIKKHVSTKLFSSVVVPLKKNV